MMPADAHARLGKLAGGAGERRIVDIGECKMAAPARQRGRDRPANSTGGAGDDLVSQNLFASESVVLLSSEPMELAILARALRSDGRARLCGSWPRRRAKKWFCTSCRRSRTSAIRGNPVFVRAGK
jgi:hypothetical protein